MFAFNYDCSMMLWLHEQINLLNKDSSLSKMLLNLLLWL